MLLHSRQGQLECIDSSAIFTDGTIMTLQPGKLLKVVNPLLSLFINASLDYSGTHDTQKQPGGPF